MKNALLIIALLISTFAHTQAIKDTLFFNNGSMIVGELDRVKLGVLSFDPDDANDITIQLRKLKTIAGHSKIFRIESVNQLLLFGKILPHPLKNFIYIVTGSDTISMGIEDISVLYPFEKSMANRFSGSVGVGYSYTRSSGLGRLNIDAKLKYVSMKDELTFNTSGIYTIYDSLFSRDKEDINFKYNYYWTRKWFITGFVVYQRNLELGLERRFQEGLGVGNKFITNKHAYAFARSGFVINQERNTEGESSKVLTELFAQFEVNFFSFEKPEINILFSQTFYYSLSQSGRFRNDGSLTLTWEAFKDFNLNLEPYNSFDSKAPSTGTKQFDYGVVFGISYTF